MTYLDFYFGCREEISREPYEDDEWDRGDTYTSWTLEGCSIKEEGEYFDVIAPFEVKSGDRVIVVYAIYSTGDSFGRAEGACKEVIDVFKDINKASDCVRAVEKTYKSWDDHTEKKVEWIREDGSEGKLDYVPWNGYFESLDSVRSEIIEVK